jgi:hypothetical protein
MSEQRTLTRRRASISPLYGWDTATALPDGRHIEVGDEFTVAGVGRFRLRAIRPNGELTGWGPITTDGNIPTGRMRTFRPDMVTTVHRDRRAIDTKRQEDN